MLRKHGHEKISRIDKTREISMPTAKQLRHLRSQPLSAPPSTTRHLALAQSPNREHALGSLSQQKASWRAVPAAFFRIAAEIVSRLAIGGGATFSNCLFAILSWVAAEFIAGCAAYAQALHYTPIIVNGVDSSDAVPVPRRSRDRTKEPFFVLISERTPGLEWHGESAPTQPARGAQARIIEAVRPVQAVDTPSRWYRAIAAALLAPLSNLPEARAGRRAIMELKTFDDRALRDIGLCRCNIEAAVRHEGREQYDRGPQ
jgi:uncharacterized protein YjiS (DUF1127 family)